MILRSISRLDIMALTVQLVGVLSYAYKNGTKGIFAVPSLAANQKVIDL